MERQLQRDSAVILKLSIKSKRKGWHPEKMHTQQRKSMEYSSFSMSCNLQLGTMDHIFSSLQTVPEGHMAHYKICRHESLRLQDDTLPIQQLLRKRWLRQQRGFSSFKLPFPAHSLQEKRTTKKKKSQEKNPTN